MPKLRSTNIQEQQQDKSLDGEADTAVDRLVLLVIIPPKHLIQ